MLSWLRKKVEEGRRAKELYGAIVTQARQPAFFGSHGVWDTPEGRAGVIIAHLFLVLDRLAREPEAGAPLARRLAETFVTDMDDCMREMGVGDLAVPKKVKRAAAALHTRCHAYRAGLAATDDGALARELASTLPGLERNQERAAEFARYLRRARAFVEEQPVSSLLAGNVAFPAPGALIDTRTTEWVP